MTAHTPVPWRLVPSDDAPWPDIEVAPNRRIRVEGRTRDEAEANAHLVVAAPDLLEALEQCLSVLTHPVVGTYLHDDPDWYHALDLAANAARAALAKARGESQ